MPRILALIASLAVVSTACSSSAPGEKAGSGPGQAAGDAERREPPGVRGIVLIVVDTLRADRLGIYGYDKPTSPQLDRFGREAVVFENAWAAAPWTVPSVASLFTATVPSFHGHRDEPDARKLHVLSGDLLTLPELLQATGYRTLAVSDQSWISPDTGFGQGFADGDFQMLSPEGRESRADAAVTRASIQKLAELGAAWRRGEGGRFFLYVHYMGPHTPYDPPADALAASGHAELRPTAFVQSLQGLDFKRYHARLWAEADAGRISRADAEVFSALYDGLVRVVDGEIGQLLDALARSGLDGQTAVVVTSDHGEAFLEHGHIAHGSTLHEEELRAPLLLRVPGWEPERRADLVGLVDVMPTLLELAGAPVPDNLDGRSLRLRGDSGRGLVSEATHDDDQARLTTADLRLILGLADARARLFDGRRDPHERRDIAGARRETTARLREVLELRLAEAAARGGSLSRGSREMDAQTRERLRALGYLQ